MVTIYFDGGLSGKNIKYGIVIIPDDNTPPIAIKNVLSSGTSNEAEWCALIAAVLRAKARGYTNLEIFGDSQMVCYGASGKWRVHAKNLIPLRDEFLKVSENIDVKVDWVRRSVNLAGIFLEKGGDYIKKKYIPNLIEESNGL